MLKKIKHAFLLEGFVEFFRVKKNCFKSGGHDPSSPVSWALTFHFWKGTSKYYTPNYYRNVVRSINVMTFSQSQLSEIITRLSSNKQ